MKKRSLNSGPRTTELFTVILSFVHIHSCNSWFVYIATICTCNIVSFPRGLPCPSSRNLNDKIKILDQSYHTHRHTYKFTYTHTIKVYMYKPYSEVLPYVVFLYIYKRDTVSHLLGKYFTSTPLKINFIFYFRNNPL